MLAVLLTFLVVFVITTAFGYFVHKALHQSWMRGFNTAHMTHHLKLYPVNDYQSETYRDPWKDNTVRFFAFASIPLVIIPVILLALGIIPLSVFIATAVAMTIVGFANGYLHDVFHIKNHWLSRYSWFRELTRLHYLHHVDMQRNFGIFMFSWDKLLGSYKDG